MKKCKSCAVEKLEIDFPITTMKVRSPSCQSCWDEIDEMQKQVDQGLYKTVDYARRGRNKRFVWDFLKHHPCEVCKESDPLVLEFDHIDPAKKHKTISQLIGSAAAIATIKDEMAKCQILCANCHKRRTAVQFNWVKATYLKNNPL